MANPEVDNVERPVAPVTFNVPVMAVFGVIFTAVAVGPMVNAPAMLSMELVSKPPVKVVRPVTFSDARPAKPEVVKVERPVAPVTVKVVPTVSPFVTATELKVAAPEELSVVKAPVPGVVAPIEVAFKAPIVVAPVTISELRLAAPEVVRPASEVAPVTVSVPATEVLPAGVTQKMGVPVLSWMAKGLAVAPTIIFRIDVSVMAV